MTLLNVEGFTLRMPKVYGDVPLLRDISFSIDRGETLGVVGESGSGKSLLSMSLMGLQPRSAVLSGSIRLEGQDLIGQTEREWRKVRGTRAAIIYQDALTSLNPGMRIRSQLSQARMDSRWGTPAALLDAVKIRDPERVLTAYPHELSGGQRQRVLIAMAIAGNPELIIADEPTTALDVTVQAQILALIDDLRKELKFGLLLVSHDLGLVAESTDRVMVMYAGDVVESGYTPVVLGAPRHHYTRGLVDSYRSLSSASRKLVPIMGTVPAPAEYSSACRFSPRCPRADEVCRTQRPTFQIGRRPGSELGGDTASIESGAACHHPLDRQLEEVR
ncbi:UNVERIFIED_CONTAM: ABC transporter ATP-binding protein [Microbacterium sp. SLM126]